MAIDLTQLQQRIIDDAQPRLAEKSEPVGDAGSGQGPARFEQLIEAPQAGPASPDNPGTGIQAPESAPAAVDSADVGQPALIGDRILANLETGPRPAPGVDGTGAAARIGHGSAVDIGDPLDRIEVQMKAAALKEATGLAATAVGKTSQGVDTMLKSQ